MALDLGLRACRRRCVERYRAVEASMIFAFAITAVLAIFAVWACLKIEAQGKHIKWLARDNAGLSGRNKILEEENLNLRKGRTPNGYPKLERGRMNTNG